MGKRAAQQRADRHVRERDDRRTRHWKTSAYKRTIAESKDGECPGHHFLIGVQVFNHLLLLLLLLKQSALYNARYMTQTRGASVYLVDGGQVHGLCDGWQECGDGHEQ